VICPFRASSSQYGAGGHAGIDISLNAGSRVCASAPGKVAFAGNTPLGRCVSIFHEGGFKSTYVSLGSISAKQGEIVSGGQPIGSSDGSADKSSQVPHLHFGIYLNGVPVDPIPLLRGLLLDPEKALFLGPWEDAKALEAYVERHNRGNFFTWLGGGLKAIGGGIAAACKETGKAFGSLAASAWKGVCRGASWLGGRVGSWLGKAFRSFYEHCLKPWLGPACRAIAGAARKVWSNRYVQALVAGVTAAVLVVLAVVGLALLIGASIAATVVAAAIGAIAAVGYAFYYAATSGASFSFAGCFLSSLAVGGAAGIGSLLLSVMAPLISSGWVHIGLAGFAKGFLIHGFVDSAGYVVFCLATGREVSPLAVLACFLIGGLMGGFGKLFMTGLFSEGTIQSLAAGWLSSGGSIFSSEGVEAISAFASELAARFVQKVVYVVFCGCATFLGDLTVRACMGLRPSVWESLLSFSTGMFLGTVSLAVQGQGITGIISKLTAGRLKFGSDLVKAVVGKGFSWSVKEGFPALVKKLNRSARALRQES
jgi:hypothetical protein